MCSCFYSSNVSPWACTEIALNFILALFVSAKILKHLGSLFTCAFSSLFYECLTRRWFSGLPVPSVPRRWFDHLGRQTGRVRTQFTERMLLVTKDFSRIDKVAKPRVCQWILFIECILLDRNLFGFLYGLLGNWKRVSNLEGFLFKAFGWDLNLEALS